MSQPVRPAARRGALAAVLAASFTTFAAVARAASGPYVALGDSYTAAPLVPNPTGNPILCGRSTNDYPQNVKRAISPTSFTDASCSSATTADMTQSQSLEGGVLVVGYPDGLPQNGSTCYPVVPFSSGDVTYFNSLELKLNDVIKQAARANGATYVDTFSPSIGHDACRGSSAWVNGIIPTSAAFPLHPNAAGEANMAEQVEGSL